MWKNAGVALVFACFVSPALALQAYVSHIDKNTDGSATYHVTIQTDAGEALIPGADFVTIYNFAGLVGGSAKAPAGWSASSEEFGKTPMLHGYPMVFPVDIPSLSNVTFTPTKAISGGAKIDGFTVTTSVSATTEGEYSAAVTRNGSGKASKQGILGTIETPAFAPRQ